MNADEHATRRSLQQLHGLCDRFEKAWEGGAGPEVSQFLESVGDLWKTWQPETRQQLLEELIKLDLEYRWQRQDQEQRTADMAEQDTLVGDQSVSNQLFLEDYLRQHPELGSSGRLSLQLVVEEYRVRQRWGDQPGHQEYLKRFPDHGPQLQEQLAQVDSDLSLEQQTQHRQLTGSNTVPSPAMASGRFGDYELLEEIARGGMGVVYKARQVSLNRVVALKMILSGQLASDEDVRRFRSEAEAAANLQHPNIVGIYEVGTIDGQHYFSMDFIEGHSLADQAVLGTMEVEEAAKLVSQVATAIEYAHQQGILHRDLKPHNVLMDGKDQPWVTDFGLAKRIEGQSDLTGTGQVLGTPSYMPPEQASADADAMGPASDVYSLGAILYELVTGRPPFKAQTPLDTLLQVLGEEPVSPHSLNGSVPADLETIILKCLDKDPRRRYESAQELVDELGRYLAGEPIQARPIGQWERAWRWCRRKPAVAALSAAVAFSLLAGLAVSSYFAISASREALVARSAQNRAIAQREEAEKARRSEKEQRGKADEAARQARVSRDKEIEQRIKAEKAREEAEHAKNAESLERQKAEESQQAVLKEAYASDMLLADTYWEKANISGIQGILDRYEKLDPDKELRGFEWDYWQHLCHLEEKTLNVSNVAVTAISYSPNGETIACGSRAGSIKLYSVQDGKHVLAFNEHKAPVGRIFFSQDSKKVVSSGQDKMIYVWDSKTGKTLLRIGPTAEHISLATFSPDGTLIASVAGGKLTFWDGETGVVKSQVEMPLQNVSAIAFSPDGKKLVVGHSRGGVSVWQVADPKKLLEYRGHHSFGILTVCFSPDGKLIASGGFDSLVRIWNAENGTDVAVTTGPVHAERVAEVRFSPDGKVLASVSADRTLRIWDAATGRNVDVLKGHASYVHHLSFHPDGRSIATASEDGEVKLWSFPPAQQSSQSLLPHNRECLWFKRINRVKAVALNKEGTILAYNFQNQIVLFDLINNRQLRTLKGHGARVTSIVFFDDDKRIATASFDKSVKVWDSQTGKTIFTLASHVDPRIFLSVRFDGKQIATGSGKQVRTWDLETGELISSFAGHFSNVGSVAFSPDGRQIASSAGNGWIKVWDVETQKELFSANTLYVHSSMTVAYNPEGTTLAAIAPSGLRLWDSTTWRKSEILKGHSYRIQCFKFFPDGGRMVTGDQDKTVKLWDLATLRPVLSLVQLKGLSYNGVIDLAVSNNGKRIAACTDYQIRVYGADQRRMDAYPSGNAKQLPGIDLTSFSDDVRLEFLAQCRKHMCPCGCNYNLFDCRIKDSTCGVSLRLLKGLIDELKKAEFQTSAQAQIIMKAYFKKQLTTK